MKLWTTTLILTAVIATTVVYAQPGNTDYIHFKLYLGKKIIKDTSALKFYFIDSETNYHYYGGNKFEGRQWTIQITKPYQTVYFIIKRNSTTPDSMKIVMEECFTIDSIQYIPGNYEIICTNTGKIEPRHWALKKLSVSASLQKQTAVQPQTQTDSLKKGYGYFLGKPYNFSITPKKLTAPATVNLKLSFITDIVTFSKSYIVLKDTTTENTNYYTIKISVSPASDMRIAYIRDETFDFSFPFLTAGYYKIEFAKGDNNVGFDLGGNKYFTVLQK